jgi:hypothetical protein
LLIYFSYNIKNKRVMEKEFVPYELALKLKQLEFDEPCFSIWKNDKLISVGGHWGMNITHSMFGFEGDMFALDECRAPTFSQAFRWFRENYRLSVLIQDWLDDYSGEIVEWTIGEDRIIYEITNRTDTYEEAEQACLIKLIEIVETKSK